jgi:plastocyanin
MNNKIIIIIVLAVIAIGGWYFYTQKQYQPNPMQPGTAQPTVQETQAGVEANTVTIQNFAFNPGTLTVKQGTTVTWINQDSATHKIKSDTFNSPDLRQGDTYKFVFTTKGSYDYSCSIHPSMTGKIVVE